MLVLLLHNSIIGFSTEQQSSCDRRLSKEMQCYLQANLHTFIFKKIVKQKQKRLKKIRSQESKKRQTSLTYNTSGRFLDKTHWQIPGHHSDQSDSSALRPGKHLHQYPYIPWDLEIIVNICKIVIIPRKHFIL